MKELLLSGCFLLFLSSVWAQQQKLNLSWSPSAMNMQQYWDSVKKKNKTQLKKPAYTFRNKQASSIQKQSDLKFILPTHINNNAMPVLSPDSDYVYNMPGTHAFDKSKAKGGVFFVPEQPSHVRNCYKQPVLVQIKSVKDYFKLLEANNAAPENISIKK